MSKVYPKLPENVVWSLAISTTVIHTSRSTMKSQNTLKGQIQLLFQEQELQPGSTGISSCDAESHLKHRGEFVCILTKAMSSERVVILSDVKL